MAEGRPALVLEEEDQTAKMSLLSFSPPSSSNEPTEPIVQTGPFFMSENREGLIKILSQLDPVSFVKVSSTCKDMNNFCYNTRGIQVQFGRWDVNYKNWFPCYISVQSPFTSEAKIELSVMLAGGFGFGNKRISAEKLKDLLNSPFVVTIREIFFTTANSAERVDFCVLEKLTTYLRSFHRVRIGTIRTELIQNWNAFAQFVQEFGVQRIEIGTRSNPKRIPLDLLPIFVSNVNDFAYYERVPDDLVLSATANHLCLPIATISLDTFKELVKRFQAGFVHNWAIGRDRPDIFKEIYYVNLVNPEPDSFVDACSEMMEVIHVKRIDKTNMKPGVLYATLRNFDNTFYLLKSDGSLGEFSICEPQVTFRNGH